MDQKTKEYLDRSLLGLTAKEDLEKLRQEMKSSFRQLREENKNQILEWKKEVKAAIDLLSGERRVDIGPIREEITQGLQKAELEAQSALNRANEFVTSLLQRIKEEVRADIDRSRQELGSTLQMIKHEGVNNVSDLKREMSADSNRFGESVDGLREEIRKVADEMTALNQKIKEAFTEVKEELGSMIRFSYADLEKRLTTLEARIKSLEKMVLP